MSLKDWFVARKQGVVLDSERLAREAPEGLWTQCQRCHEPLYTKELARQLNVCPKCGYHFRIGAKERIAQLLDEGSFRESHQELRSLDPLGFDDGSKPYRDRLNEAYRKRGTGEAVLTGTGTMDGLPVALGVMDFFFMGGSMGSVVGEKVTRLTEQALAQRLPLILICASGGARMQEGTLSLMQMAKTSCVLARFAEARLLYLSVLTDPTTGGVTASFATLADLILAEPGALIGFAGRRVIEQTIRQKAPPDFQTAESMLAHGLLDLIVPRPRLRDELVRLLRLHGMAPRTVEEGALSR